MQEIIKSSVKTLLRGGFLVLGVVMVFFQWLSSGFTLDSLQSCDYFFNDIQCTAMNESSRKARARAVDYNDIRNQVRNGDVLMYRGKSLGSRVIMFATRSKYSHAGIAVWWNERLMVMEAIGKGVVVRPLSLSVERYYGDVELYQPIEDIPDSDRHRMITFAQQELGKEYATWKATLLGLKILFQKNKEKRDTLRRERQLFCSYYVAQIYNSIERDLKKGVSDRFMTPGDIAESPMLRKVAALRKTR